MTDYNQLIKAVADIARRAGDEILRIYGESDFGVEDKADKSPLTRADQASNEVIVRELSQLELRAPIVSEESKQIPFSERRQYTRFWLVDPLDGTKEFIKRNGEFTVNIALIDTNSPLLSVVYTPVSDDLFWAIRRRGAYRVVNGQDTRISASTFSLRDQGLKVVASRSHLTEETQAFMDQLHEPEIVSKGSSLKILMLATGEAQLYPRLGPTMEWDTGAAQLILEEAGGRLIDQSTGQPLLYNKESLLNPHFVAYGKVSDADV